MPVGSPRGRTNRSKYTVKGGWDWGDWWSNAGQAWDRVTHELRGGEEVGKNLAGLAKEALLEHAKVDGRLGTNVIGPGATSGVRGETGGGFDCAGSADRQEDRASVEGSINLIEIVGNFTEPANVGANLRAAFATRNGGGWLVELRVIEGRTGAGFAARFEKFAVHVKHTGRAGELVEIVDVLGAEEEPVESVLECGDGLVGRIGLGVGGVAAAHGVEVPDELGIAAPGGGRGDIFEAVVAPEAIGVAEGGDAAFGGDASAGEQEEAVGGGNGEGLRVHGWRWGEFTTERAEGSGEVVSEQAKRGNTLRSGGRGGFCKGLYDEILRFAQDDKLVFVFGKHNGSAGRTEAEFH